jgi:hypothetical protein
MANSDTCRFLQSQPVPICAAFRGGLRTPREVELERLCRSANHVRCPYFIGRTEAEDAATASVGIQEPKQLVKEEP